MASSPPSTSVLVKLCFKEWHVYVKGKQEKGKDAYSSIYQFFSVNIIRVDGKMRRHRSQRPFELKSTGDLKVLHSMQKLKKG